METFAQRVRDRLEITGVRFGVDAYTITLYADDVVVTLDNPVRALPVFLEEVEAFSVVSGFWVNLSKSRVLDLALPRETLNELTQRYPFRWEEDSVPYLGGADAQDVNLDIRRQTDTNGTSRRDKREEEEAIQKDGAKHKEGEKNGVVHEENDLPARESDEEGVWPEVHQGVEKSDEVGVRLVVRQGVEKNEDPEPLGRQTEGFRHVPGGTWLTQVRAYLPNTGSVL
ncbi:hypothetical protein NDU88_004913 [Pleurodeles waltl]|uniref:Reverse transcriptase domain-containing protein n=1 Tax=Pleurodeles waltl TaxID=8319 RepID=A0AAV7PGI9_PLEWA|nr:hypothetical protein NDU88_004913 [Pleurodeles waltl]